MRKKILTTIYSLVAVVSLLLAGGCDKQGDDLTADYGYVGAARGKISLYKGKECIEKNIPQEEAVEKLVELIKANGDWK